MRAGESVGPALTQAVVACRSVALLARGGPEEAGELAGGGDGGDVGGLAAFAQMGVDAVEAVLAAPGHVECALVDALLAADQGDAAAWWALVVQAASTNSRRACRDPVLVIAPLVADSPLWYSDGTRPIHAVSRPGRSNRCQSWISACSCSGE